jgi:prepilin-type N-terminal cleavage/methylation domain-containing protein/prepilin-type processing-associated H-X9-DG protein
VHPLVNTSRCEGPRRGFTLVELLAVIGILGMLFALLLSAVQEARETARRTQCMNNLKQIGLAILSHHDVCGAFPTAGTNSEDFTFTPKHDPGFERLGWGFQILPHMEQRVLYEAAHGYSPIAPNPALGSRALVEIKVPTYTCPSRGVRVVPDAEAHAVYALGDYAGVTFGYIGDVQWRNSHNDEDQLGQIYRQFAWRSIIAKAGQNYDGVYHQWERVRSVDVSDGLSNTLAVMEKAVWSQRYESSAQESSTRTCEGFGWAHNAHQPTMRSISGDGGHAFGGASGNWYGSPGRGIGPRLRGDDVPRLGERDWDQGFGSPHRGVVMALFADGSVRPIDDEIDSEMGGALFRLACRDDGATTEIAAIP